MIAVTGVNSVDYTDTADYLAAARSLHETGTFPDIGVSTYPFFRPPLYPYFIAGLWTVFPGSLLVIKVVQVLMHGATCWLLYKTGYLITGNRLMSYLGAVMFAINPLFLYGAVGIQTEVMLTFLIVWAFYILARMARAERVLWRQAVGVGVLFALGGLCKPSALGIGFAMGVAFLFFQLFKKKHLIVSAVIVPAMFLTILPWSFYVWHTKGEFFLINDGGGFNVWMGNHRNYIPIFDGTVKSIEESRVYEGGIFLEIDALKDEWRRTHDYDHLSMKDRERLWQEKGIENMKQDPQAAAWLILLKGYVFWRPFTDAATNTYSRFLVSAATQIPVFIFAIFGIWRTGRDAKTREVVLLFFVMALSITMIHMALVSGMRYRLPYVDPILTVFAGIGLGSLIISFMPRLGIFESRSVV